MALSESPAVSYCYCYCSPCTALQCVRVMYWVSILMSTCHPCRLALRHREALKPFVCNRTGSPPRNNGEPELCYFRPLITPFDYMCTVTYTRALLHSFLHCKGKNNSVTNSCMYNETSVATYRVRKYVSPQVLSFIVNCSVSAPKYASYGSTSFNWYVHI